MVERPRRFFGLFCAHYWERWGERIITYKDGAVIKTPTLRCKHCGDAKVAY